MTWHHNDNSEPSIASQEQVEAYLQTLCSTTDASEHAKLKNTNATCCSHGSETDTCPNSRYGMICARSTADRGEGTLTFSAEDFLARISAAQEKAPGQLTARDQCSGPSSSEWLAKWDGPTCSWKTAQCSLTGGLRTYSEHLPKWGMMRDGEFGRVQTWEHVTTAKGAGYLPTPLKRDHKDSALKGNISRKRSGHQTSLPTYCSVKWGVVPSPSLAESMMAWPTGWAALEPLAMAKIQEWRQRHFAFFRTAS